MCQQIILTGYKSDHDIPIIVYRHNNFKCGPGFWKLNTTLLQDESCTEEIRKIIRKIKADKFETVGQKLDLILLEVRGYTIKHATRKKKSNENKLKVIDRKLASIQKDLVVEQPLFDKQSNLKQMEKLQSDRNEIIALKTRGAMIRTRREWHEQGKKNTIMLFSLEKSNYKRKNRFVLKKADGEIINENDKIIKEQHRFYNALYQKDDAQLPSDFFDDVNLPQVSEEDNQMLVADITLDELKTALSKMPADKVPGPEGIPPEFYRFFFDELGVLLLYVIQKASVKGFTKNASRGIISLMEKPQKHMLALTNWRPLSLLGTEFKLLSKILATRLNQILPKIIHPDQYGFIVGRGVQDNIPDLITAIEFAEEQGIDLLLVNYDFMKAFDMVDWDVLFKIMSQFSFHHKYIDMIRAMFTA